MNTNEVQGSFQCYTKVSLKFPGKLLVDYRMKLATQLVVNKKRHSA